MKLLYCVGSRCGAAVADLEDDALFKLPFPNIVIFVVEFEIL